MYFFVCLFRLNETSDYTNIIQDNAITVRTYRSAVVNFVHGKSRKIFLLQVKLITCGRSV